MISLLLPMTLPMMNALFHLLEAVKLLLKVRVPQAIQGARKVVDSHPKNSKVPIREASLNFLNLAPPFRLSESKSVCLHRLAHRKGMRRRLATVRFDYSDFLFKVSRLRTARPPIPPLHCNWINPSF